MALFPGETACRSVGGDCDATAEFDPGAPPGPKLYVRPGASGDGSLARPFGTIADALRVVTAPTTVVLSQGVFPEEVRLPGGVTLWGACAGLTRVGGVVQDPSYGSYGTDPARVARVTLGGAGFRGAWVAGGELALEGVIVSEGAGGGILVGAGGLLRAREVVVRDPQLSGTFARGIEVVYGSRAELERVVVERALEYGILVGLAGTTCQLRDVVVRETLRRSSSERYALYVSDRASVDVEGGVFEQNGFTQVIAAMGGTTLRLDQTVIRDSPEDGQGLGLVVVSGAAANVTRTLFERARDASVVVSDANVTFTDVLVSDTRQGLLLGSGMDFRGGSTVTVARVSLDRNPYAGLTIAEDGTVATIEDVSVVGSSGQDGAFGRGIEVILGAHASLARVTVRGSGDVGLLVGAEGSEAVAQDTLVAGTISSGDRQLGRGVQVQGGASLRLERGLVERNGEVGLFAYRSTASLSDLIVRGGDPAVGLDGVVVSESTLTLGRVALESMGLVGLHAYGAGTVEAADLVVRDTRGDAMGFFGRGLDVEEGAHVSLVRGSFERNRDVQIMALGASIELERVVVLDTLPRDCSVDTCPDAPGGTGIGSYAGMVRATDFLVSGAPLCGVQIGETGQMDLLRGEVREATIGACVHATGYDIARLSEEVSYNDNGINLDSVTLPVPAAAVRPRPSVEP